MKTLFVALMYAPLLPVGLIIALFGILFEYSISKYVLLRRNARPNRLSSDLSETITKLIPWAIFFYSGTLYFFMDIMQSDGA
jgi:hypothetical protein